MRVLIPLERSCECTESDYQCDFCYERVGEEVRTLLALRVQKYKY